MWKKKKFTTSQIYCILKLKKFLTVKMFLILEDGVLFDPVNVGADSCVVTVHFSRAVLSAKGNNSYKINSFTLD